MDKRSRQSNETTLHLATCPPLTPPPGATHGSGATVLFRVMGSEDGLLAASRGGAERPLCMPPLRGGEAFGDAYDVVLLVDAREQFEQHRG